MDDQRDRWFAWYPVRARGDWQDDFMRTRVRRWVWLRYVRRTREYNALLGKAVTGYHLED